MKIALRDDDLNYFFKPDIIENNYKGIWEICPVSMSVIPFIKGYWPEFIKEVEEIGPGLINKNTIDRIIADDTIYPIAKNEDLVKYVKDKISDGKIYLTIHGIHHRNEDTEIPQFTGNFGIGTEFYTSRDLSTSLAKAISYVEEIFQQPIEVFTPPQNLYSRKGIKAVLSNRLSICGDLPSPKKLDAVKLLGIMNYIKYLIFKLRHKNIIYPYPLISKRSNIIGHQRLQPGTNLKAFYSSFQNVYDQNGSFVISTHSYGFDYKMKNSNKTMGETLREFIIYASQKPNVQFVNLKQIFESI